MLKLMKYELIKQRTSKVIIGAILALLEVCFWAKKKSWPLLPEC